MIIEYGQLMGSGETMGQFATAAAITTIVKRRKLKKKLKKMAPAQRKAYKKKVKAKRRKVLRRAALFVSPIARRAAAIKAIKNRKKIIAKIKARKAKKRIVKSGITTTTPGNIPINTIETTPAPAPVVSAPFDDFDNYKAPIDQESPETESPETESPETEETEKKKVSPLVPLGLLALPFLLG